MTELWDMDEASQAMRRTPDTLRWWRKHGRGPPSFKIGRRVMYDRADVEAFIEQEKARTVTSADE